MHYFYILCLCLCLGFQAPLHAVDLENIVDTATQTPTVKTQNTKKADKKNTIISIRIKGNKNIKTDTILSKSIVIVGESLNPYKLKRSVTNIQAMGLFRSVNSKVKSTEKGKRVTFIVKENPIIDTFEVTGNTLFTDSEILDVLLSKKNTILNKKNVPKDIQAIEALYKDKGYFLAKVHGINTPKKNRAPYKINLSEGVLEEIIITGNTRTKDYVILREMSLKTGEPLNEKIMQSDIRKIYNLNYFSKLEPDFIDGETANTYKLKLDLEEKRTGSLNFGGGYGQRSGLFIYSDIHIDNIFGTGQLAALKGQWGKKLTSYQFKYYNPWMWENRRSFLFKTWNTEGGFGYNPLSKTYTEEKRSGAYVEFGIPHTYEFRTSHGFKVENIYHPDLSDSSDNTLSNSSYYIQSYTFGVSYDSRDFRHNPREGYYHHYTLERGIKVSPKSLNFSKHDLTLTKFTPTFEKQTLATRVILGKMYGQVEDSEQYFVGGPNTVRGYEEFPDSFGFGHARALLNIEYRFLFNDIFQALVFIDGGWASSLGSLRNGKIGKGLGFRIQSPLGPIRLDFGVDEEAEIRTHFNIGHVF